MIDESIKNPSVGNAPYIREMSPTQNFSCGNGGSITSERLPEALRPPGVFHKDYTKRNEVPTMARTHHHTPYKHRKFNYEFERWTWLSNEPKEWRTTFKHRKRRAAVRRALVGKRDWDDTVWPLDKKPWVYYY
jgi:hypothetical protein